MKVIAVINQKGGVGKSTTCLALGAGLSLNKYKILYVDLDAQGNLSYTLNASTNGYNVMEVLQSPETISNQIQHLCDLDVVASSSALSLADTVLIQTGKEYRLKEALAFIKDKYDYVIIDTPPALGILTINALTACNGIVIPAQADIFSLQGISQLSGTIDTVKKYCNNSLKILGILLTRYNLRSIISKEIAQMLSKTASDLNTKLFNTKIRECISLKEAQVVRQNIFSYAPKSNACADYYAFIQEFLNEEK